MEIIKNTTPKAIKPAFCKEIDTWSKKKLYQESRFFRTFHSLIWNKNMLSKVRVTMPIAIYSRVDVIVYNAKITSPITKTWVLNGDGVNGTMCSAIVIIYVPINPPIKNQRASNGRATPHLAKIITRQYTVGIMTRTSGFEKIFCTKGAVFIKWNKTLRFLTFLHSF